MQRNRGACVEILVLACFGLAHAQDVLNCTLSRGCSFSATASRSSEVFLNNRKILTLPANSVASDYEVAVRAWPFSRNLTAPDTNPTGSKLATNSLVTIFIDQAFRSPVTVSLNVDLSRDRRVLSDEPLVHWYRREEQSWRVLCNSNFDATTNTVSAEIPLNVLQSASFRPTRDMPALFAAFYVETTLTCLPPPPPPPSTTPIPSSDRDWVTDWKWDDLTPEQYVLVIGLAIAAGICLVCGGFLVSFLARAEPKPPRRTAKLDRGPALDTGRVIFQPSPEPTQLRPVEARSMPPQMMSTPPMYQPTPAPLASRSALPMAAARSAMPMAPTARSMAPMAPPRHPQPLPPALPPPPVHYETLLPYQWNDPSVDVFDYDPPAPSNPYYPPQQSNWDANEPLPPRGMSYPPMDPSQMQWPTPPPPEVPVTLGASC